MYQDVLSFWFEEIDRSLWWTKDNAFDQTIIKRFGDIHKKAVCCELFEWRSSSQGRLAEIIVLDQFSRNMYRDTALSFANDPMALALAQEAITVGADQELDAVQRSFLYMPFMHSESLAIHEYAEKLFRDHGSQNNLDFELKHKRIIERFGRYPHRNKILGRKSTPEEAAFLQEPGSSF